MGKHCGKREWVYASQCGLVGVSPADERGGPAPCEKQHAKKKRLIAACPAGGDITGRKLLNHEQTLDWFIVAAVFLLAHERVAEET